MKNWIIEYRYADQDARARVRPEHLDYLNELVAQGRVVAAGPFVEGERAMVIVRAENEDEVRRVIDNDPYTAHHVGEGHRISEWKVAVGSLGG